MQSTAIQRVVQRMVNDVPTASIGQVVKTHTYKNSVQNSVDVRLQVYNPATRVVDSIVHTYVPHLNGDAFNVGDLVHIGFLDKSHAKPTVIGQITNPDKDATELKPKVGQTPLDKDFFEVDMPTGNLHYRKYLYDDWTNLGGILTSDPAVNKTHGIHVVARGSDGGCWHISNNGTKWSGWENLGGKVLENTKLQCYWANVSTFDVWVVGTNSANYLKQWIAGSGWGDWVQH